MVCIFEKKTNEEGVAKMKVKLEINVFSKERAEGFIYNKIYESTVVPQIGEKIKDNLFAECKTVIDVIHDLANSESLVLLESKEVPDDRLNGHIQEVAKMHEWVLKK